MEERQSDVPTTSGLLLGCGSPSLSSQMSIGFPASSAMFLEPGVSGLSNAEGTAQMRCPACNKERPDFAFVELPCHHRFCNRCADQNNLCFICLKAFAGYPTGNKPPAPKLFNETSSNVSSMSVGTSSIWEPLPMCSMPRTDIRPPLLFRGSPSTAFSSQPLSTPTSSDNAAYGGRPTLPTFSKISPPGAVDSLFTLPLSPSKEDIVWNPASETSLHSNFNAAYPKCSMCNERAAFASVRCIQCCDTLCNACVVAHNRVCMSRDRNLISLQSFYQGLNIPIQPLKNDAAKREERGSENCENHDSTVIGTCLSCCCSNLCKLCISSHAKHQIVPYGDLRASFNALLSSTKYDQKDMKDALVTICRITDRLKTSVEVVRSEISSVAHSLIRAIKERKHVLLEKVDTTSQSKLDTLQVQSELISRRLAAMNEVLQKAESLAVVDEVSEGQMRDAFEGLLSILREPRLVLVPNETDQIKFIPPDSVFVNKVRNVGELISGPCAQTSHIVGESYKRAIRDRMATVIVQLRDACGEICTSSSPEQGLSATFLNPKRQEIQTRIVEREPGIHAVSYYPVDEGNHILDIRLRGVSISGCPAEVHVRKGRDYAAIAREGPIFTFGGEGSEDGQLCRPWGICCDLKGRIIVADRSNNRIQIFEKDGRFILKFGSAGSRPGQFNRPAGVAVNSMNEIVVADKDNHRIQVFNDAGTFLLKFGERGRAPGTFNYPWGVAVNAYNEIAVSDTRNHRVQIFSAQGQYLRKCGFDSALYYKSLDSPRGVCYMPDGQLLISDFNNHRLILIAPRASTEFKCYGSEGQTEGYFCRPQGITIDNEGHILVCDSRNNRVQVLSAEDFRCIALFGSSPSSKSSSPKQPSSSKGTPESYFGNSSLQRASSSIESGFVTLDRPTDLCVSPDGFIYVVDFGSNYIRVY